MKTHHGSTPMAQNHVPGTLRAVGAQTQTSHVYPHKWNTLCQSHKSIKHKQQQHMHTKKTNDAQRSIQRKRRHYISTLHTSMQNSNSQKHMHVALFFKPQTHLSAIVTCRSRTNIDCTNTTSTESRLYRLYTCT